MKAPPRLAASTALALLLGCGCGCGEDPPAPAAPSASVAPPVQEEVTIPATAPLRVPGERLRVHSARELDSFTDLATILDLDLALGDADRVDFAATDDGSTPCEGLDLRRLAVRLPELRRLRISGCQAAVHAGLDSFAALDELELVDLVLDGVTMGRLLSLPTLKTLRLTRVTPGSESHGMLRGLEIERLALRELAPESPLAELFGLIRSLRAIELHGSWAGHKTMLKVAKADRLRELVLRDTDIGNFSLNQVKGLEHLSVVDLRGSTFNDKTPLYFRDLPLTSFTCACPNLGDNGLRSLRHVKDLRRLQILSSRIASASEENLGEFKALEALTFHGPDPGQAGFAALAGIEGLRELELEIEPGELSDPALRGLGELSGLRKLILRSAEIDDRIAPQLGKLHALEVLELGGTSISDATLTAVAEMPQLERLILHHTRVTNRGLVNLKGLGKLRVLELDHTDVVDAGVAHLSSLRELRELRLDATLVTDRSIDTIVGLSQLVRLNLADTVVSSAGAARLQELESLESVNLARTRAYP